MKNSSETLYGAETDSPRLIEIEPTYSCNLRCVMCHVPTHSDRKPIFLDIKKLESATQGLEGCHIILGSEYEPTIHPNLEDLFRLIIKRNWKVDFLSNATKLHYLDQGLLADVPFHVFNASFDGYSKESFEHTREGADYDIVKNNVIRTAKILRARGAFTAINATMVRSNLKETVDMVKMWNDEGFDLIRLIVAQARDTRMAVIEESLLPVKSKLFRTFHDVANEIVNRNMSIGARSGFFESELFNKPDGAHLHQATLFSNKASYRYVPGVRQDFQSGSWPGMSVRCMSPFVYCRVRWDGNVDLCNRRDRVIGNIYERSLLEIWHGEKARNMRDVIRKDIVGCEDCDYLKFCIQNRLQDYDDESSYFASGLYNSPSMKDVIFKIKEL
jgi:radical SAM protein with 4Fe4S-binding SPASM domain